MHYVEVLRARRALLWYTGIALGLMILAVLSVYAGSHGELHASDGSLRLGDLVIGCAFGGWIVLTCVAPGLSNESALTTPIIWTRPASRERIAWRYVAVDAIAILLGYLVLIAIAILALASLGATGMLVWGPAALATFALGVGASLMWYALVLLVSARMPGRGGMIAGLSWAAFFVLGALWAAPMPPLVHAVFTVLNYVNPMAWIGGVSSASQQATHHVITLPLAYRIVGCWAIAGVAAVAAVRLWATREV